jgi:hypothetical protein
MLGRASKILEEIPAGKRDILETMGWEQVHSKTLEEFQSGEGR